MGCGCNNLPPELGMKGMGGLGNTPDPCDLPQYWIVQPGANGKCYNTCLVGEYAYEVDQEFCSGMTAPGGGALNFNLSTNQILVMAAGVVLVVALMSRN